MNWKQIRKGEHTGTFVMQMGHGLLVKECHKNFDNGITHMSICFVPDVTLSMTGKVIPTVKPEKAPSAASGGDLFKDLFGAK